MVEKAAADYRGWVRDLFTGLAREAGVPDAAGLARQLHLLYDGAGLSARMDHDPSAAVAARAAAEALLDAALGAAALIPPGQSLRLVDLGVAIAVDVRERTRWQVMDERGGVLAEHRDDGHLLNGHDSGGKVRGQFVLIRERARDGVDVMPATARRQPRRPARHGNSSARGNPVTGGATFPSGTAINV